MRGVHLARLSRVDWLVWFSVKTTLRVFIFRTKGVEVDDDPPIPCMYFQSSNILYPDSVWGVCASGVASTLPGSAVNDNRVDEISGVVPLTPYSPASCGGLPIVPWLI